MEQQRIHDRDRIWADWMRSANDGDGMAYRRPLDALATASAARNAQMEPQSTITFPACGHAASETMPTDARWRGYDCKGVRES
jgi:hypothetical protein